MGKYKHHSGSVSGGVDLSKGKTPHDSLEKYMPVDDKASGLFKLGKPYSMGASKRGPLDKHGMSQDHKMAYDRAEISRLKKDIYYDDAKKHDSKGPTKLDPMHNGKPGVQKEDFDQFKSKGPEMMGNNMHPKPVKKRTMTKTLKKLPRQKA